MLVHVTFYPGDPGPLDRPPMVSVDVWPADKPTVRERIAFRRYLAAVKRLRRVTDSPIT